MVDDATIGSWEWIFWLSSNPFQSRDRISFIKLMIFYEILSLGCAQAQRLIRKRVLNRVTAERSQDQMIISHVVTAFLWSDCKLHLLILRALRWVVAITLFCVSLLLVFINRIIQLVGLALVRIFQLWGDAQLLHFLTAFFLRLVSLASLLGFCCLQQQVIDQDLVFEVADFFLWVGDSGGFMREFAGNVYGSRSFRLSCMGDLADALFTSFARWGRLLVAIGVEHILLTVKRSHRAHHMRFDHVHTLSLVERLSLHEQVLDVDRLCLVKVATFDILGLVLLQTPHTIMKFIILFEPVCQIWLYFFFEK